MGGNVFLTPTWPTAEETFWPGGDEETFLENVTPTRPTAEETVWPGGDEEMFLENVTPSGRGHVPKNLKKTLLRRGQRPRRRSEKP